MLSGIRPRDGAGAGTSGEKKGTVMNPTPPPPPVIPSLQFDPVLSSMHGKQNERGCPKYHLETNFSQPAPSQEVGPRLGVHCQEGAEKMQQAV